MGIVKCTVKCINKDNIRLVKCTFKGFISFIKGQLSVTLICILVIHNYTRFLLRCQPPFFTFTENSPYAPISCLFFRHVAQYLCINIHQLLLWLTVHFPNLCISVYTYTHTPAVAPACPSIFG